MARKPLALCPIYPGLSDAEGMRLRFGTEHPPESVRVVVVRNAFPPDGVDYGWGERPRDSAVFRETWAKLERAA